MASNLGRECRYVDPRKSVQFDDIWTDRSSLEAPKRPGPCSSDHSFDRRLDSQGNVRVFEEVAESCGSRSPVSMARWPASITYLIQSTLKPLHSMTSLSRAKTMSAHYPALALLWLISTSLVSERYVFLRTF